MYRSIATDITSLSEKRNQITDSLYVAHLGDCDTFFEKFARHTDGLAHKVFLADGGQWIWDKVSERYPGSVQILDYYHLWERYCGFAALHFADPAQGAAWLDNQQACLFWDQIGQLVANLLTEQSQSESAKESEQKPAQLITYVLNNLEPIRYGSFRKQGYWIGSDGSGPPHFSTTPLETVWATMDPKRGPTSGQPAGGLSKWTMAPNNATYASRINNLSYTHYSSSLPFFPKIITDVTRS